MNSNPAHVEAEKTTLFEVSRTGSQVKMEFAKHV